MARAQRRHMVDKTHPQGALRLGSLYMQRRPAHNSRFKRHSKLGFFGLALVASHLCIIARPQHISHLCIERRQHSIPTIFE
jgi:hypothetical protein